MPLRPLRLATDGALRRLRQDLLIGVHVVKDHVNGDEGVSSASFACGRAHSLGNLMDARPEHVASQL